MDILEDGTSWRDYNIIEKDFMNYTEYVPISAKNELTWSPKLRKILLDIGSRIDPIFEVMMDYKKHRKRHKNIVLRKNKKKDVLYYCEFFKPIYQLSKRQVTMKSEFKYNKKILPFESSMNYQNKPIQQWSPYWWVVYNKSKHKIGWEEQANLIQTSTALAGLFVLNVIHEKSWFVLLDRGIIKMKSRMGEGVRLELDLKSVLQEIIQGTPFNNMGGFGAYIQAETELFRMILFE